MADAERKLSNGKSRIDFQTDPSKYRQAAYHIVVPGYFETLRTRLLQGRMFTDADNNNIDQKTDLPRQVIVDDALAALAFHG